MGLWKRFSFMSETHNLRLDIEPNRQDWVLRHDLRDIGVFSDYQVAIAEAIRFAQRQLSESQIFIHDTGGQQFLVWQTRMG
jgi:hypothetical protein